MSGVGGPASRALHSERRHRDAQWAHDHDRPPPAPPPTHSGNLSWVKMARLVVLVACALALLGAAVRGGAQTPRNCQQLPAGSSSGVYQLQLTADSQQVVEAYCDMETDGGGWTVVQRRADIGPPRQSFDQDWETYKAGFGSLDGEFWWGLEKLSAMTARGDMKYELRVDLGGWEGDTAYAVYQNVKVSKESGGYRLTGGEYSGTAGDSLSYHFGQKFSTKDRDQDTFDGSCANLNGGGWWYSRCHHANLNGVYYTGPDQPSSVVNDIVWKTWKGFYYTLKTVQMKVRPINA